MTTGTPHRQNAGVSATALPSPSIASRPLAVGVVAVAAVLTVAGWVLLVLNIGTDLPDGTDWRIGDVGALALLALAAVMARRMPRHGLTWVVLATALSQALAMSVNEYAVFALLTHDDLAGGATAQWLGVWVWVPGYCLLATLVLLLFPDGRPPSPRWRPLAWASALTMAGVMAWFAFVPYEDLGEPVFDPTAEHPVASSAIADVLGAAGVLFAPCVVLCALSVLVRLRRSSGEERQQLRWFGAGVVVALLFGLAGQAGLEDVGLAAAYVALVGAIAVAVLRHGLWELGPIARRSIVYAVLSVAVLAGYGVAVLVLSRGEAVATAIIAAALIPLHARVDRAVNRLLYGDRDEPFAAARRLGERLAMPGDPLEEIRQALRLPRVEIVDASPELGRGQAPPQFSGEVVVELVFAGERIGHLVAGGREMGDADRRALEELAPSLAAAVHAQRLTEDLRRSRERLVAAREEERRRLRADLHDEVGPSLAILALRLDADGHDELAAQARSDLARIRAIVRDLRPAALDDLGLAEALAQEIDAVRSGGLDARLEAPEPLGELPAGVEVAAYRIAREALSNVVRHARASSCVLALTREDDALVVRVTDDGRGISGHAPRGVGLESMAARADELGGSFSTTSSGSGTRVEARLPL